MYRFFICLLVIIPCSAWAQVLPQQIKEGLQTPVYTADTSRWNQVREFYEKRQYAPVWKEASRQVFLQRLARAAEEGLNPADYAYATREPVGSISSELALTDAAFHYWRDMMNGIQTPSFGYDGLRYRPPVLVPLTWTNAFLTDQYVDPDSLLFKNYKEPFVLKKRMALLLQRSLEHPGNEVKITATQVNRQNRPLIEKLFHLGFLDSIGAGNDAAVVKALKKAQQFFDMFGDGVLHSNILQQLNIPVTVRLEQLKAGLNQYRWLFGLSRNEPVIVVNIPAAYLRVYGPEGIALAMRVIVGKPSTPTPTLTSRVEEVILYPYWVVPKSILKEYLPAIKRNPGYVNANNFQLVNSRGKVVDPWSVSWSTITVANFPFMLRQSTGCDNALGTIKLNFYSPFGVYLHDTPNKGLFLLNKRYFSHGCMRMEKPLDMGHLLLQHNRVAIDTLEAKGCLRNQSPIMVPVEQEMAVIVWYNPVGLDEKGNLVLFEDVYHKLNR